MYNKNYEKFKIISSTKKFVEYIDKIIINYPRTSYVLKDRILNSSYNLLEYTHYANVFDDERLKYQKKIIATINMLDFYLDISYQNKYISQKKLNHLARILEEIKKLTYGWIKINES